MSVNRCRFVDLPKISDPRGNLTFVEGNRHVPFSVQRVYYLYDVPEGGGRGGHGHKALEQLLIAVSGTFEVALDDGREKRVVRLDRADRGLYICPMIWRTLENFSAGAVCLVLASTMYDESDYYREYDEFLAATERG